MRGFKFFLLLFIVLLILIGVKHSTLDTHTYINFFTKPSIVALSSLATLAGFILSVWLVLVAKSIKNTVIWVDQIRDFNQKRTVNMNKLTGHRDTMIKNHLLDEILVSDLIIEVNKFRDYNNIITFHEKIMVKKTLRHLNKGTYKINKQMLNRQLTFIISCYNRKKGGII